MSFVTSLLRRTDAVDADGSDTPKHLNWIMLTALGIGATIGAGIFAMPWHDSPQSRTRRNFIVSHNWLSNRRSFHLL